MTVRSMKILALCSALAACADGAETQVLTGRVDTTKGALAIRAVTADDVVTATPVRTDGSFTLTLPAGSTYRLEVLTRDGVKNIVKRSGNVLRDLSFKVCQPTDPFDIGGVGDPGTTGLCLPNDPTCTKCDPMTMDCEVPPPRPPCDPMVDPNCGCDVIAADGTCCATGDPSCGPQPCTDPNDPGCVPPPKCDPTVDPMCCYADGSCPPPTCDPGDPNCCAPDGTGNCEPPPCNPGEPNCGEPPPSCDPNDPMCKCNDGSCPPPPCSSPNDPNCGGCSDPTAPGCAPPCGDPMDPTTCDDPCVNDPASCGCMVDPTGQPNCWSEPQPCCDDGTGTTCDPTDGMSPDNVPGDFGCEGM